MCPRNSAYYARDYIYDAVGNRLATDFLSSPGIHDFTYAAGSNQLTARRNTTHTLVLKNWTYSHGASGNRETSVYVGVSTTDYFYDSTDRLIEASISGVPRATFAHNAAGQRVVKTTAATVMHYTYNLAGQLIAEQRSTGALLKEYIRLDGLVLGFVSGSALHWVHQDHIGQPRKVASQNGDIQWRTRYEPFGQRSTTTGTVPINLRFPGQYWDWETQFNYNGFRDYDFLSGRYAQSDPIGLAGGWNTYAYVGGNPVMRVDPKGLAWEDVVEGLASARSMLKSDLPYPSAIQCFGTNYWPGSTKSSRGWYRYDIDKICLDWDALRPNLTCVEKIQLTITIFHETLHRRDFLQDYQTAYDFAVNNGEQHAQGNSADPVNAEASAIIIKNGWLLQQYYCGSSCLESDSQWFN